MIQFKTALKPCAITRDQMSPLLFYRATPRNVNDSVAVDSVVFITTEDEAFYFENDMRKMAHSSIDFLFDRYIVTVEPFSMTIDNL